jgi:hypothetical protein
MFPSELKGGFMTTAEASGEQAVRPSKHSRSRSPLLNPVVILAALPKNEPLPKGAAPL